MYVCMYVCMYVIQSVCVCAQLLMFDLVGEMTAKKSCMASMDHLRVCSVCLLF